MLVLGGYAAFLKPPRHLPSEKDRLPTSCARRKPDRGFQRARHGSLTVALNLGQLPLQGTLAAMETFSVVTTGYYWCLAMETRDAAQNPTGYSTARDCAAHRVLVLKAWPVHLCGWLPTHQAGANAPGEEVAGGVLFVNKVPPDLGLDTGWP